MKTAVEQTALEQAARELCAAHYSKRFGKPVDDCHVQMNVDANWHALFADQVSEAVTAYLANLPSGPVTEDDGRLTAIDRLRLHLEDAETFAISSDDLEGAIAEFDALRSALSRQPGAGVESHQPVRYLYDFVDVTTGATVEEVSKIDRTGEPRVSNVRPLYAHPAPAEAEPGIREARLRGLIEWLEKLEGPDRETDWLVADLLNIPEPFPQSALWPPFVAAAELDTLRKRVAELEAGWMPIETAPEGRCQMWVADSGQRGMGQVVFGTVFVWPDSRSYRPDGHHGDWNVTHWRPIPVPPPLSAQEKE